MFGKPPPEFKGLWSLSGAVLDYHKKKNLEDKHEEYTYHFKDGSTLTVNIESVWEEKEFRNADYRKAYCHPDEKTYTGIVLTKKLEIREWKHEEKYFRTFGAAKKYVAAECKKTEASMETSNG